MKIRSKLAALLGAGFLTFALAGMALASTNLSNGGDPLSSYEQLCDDFEDLGILPGEGEVGIHFIVTSADSQDGTISGHIDPGAVAFGPVGETNHGGGQGAVHFYVVVDGDGDSVVTDATTTITGNNLVISHVCVGEPGGGGGGDTDQPPTDTLPAPSGTSGPSDGAWLLVVALGVLLASVVVLTPARAKSRR